MEKLLLTRVFLKNRNVTSVFLMYVLVITVTVSFSLLTLVMYMGYHSPFQKSEYDYRITEFDDNSIDNLNGRNEVIDLYSLRIVNTEISNGERSESIDLNLVDNWDEKSVSPFGKRRIVRGCFGDNTADGIVIDYTLAKKLDADVGDTVDIAMSDTALNYTVIAILEPFPEQACCQAVCLCNDYFMDRWLQSFTDCPSYSLLFVDTNTEDSMDDYFYNEYEIPDLENVTDDEYDLYRRNCVLKKEWFESEVEDLTYYTPSVTIIISILGTIIMLLFVLRGMTEICTRLERISAVLVALGLEYKRIAGTMLCGEFMILLPAMTCSGMLVKLLYNVLIDKYYLSWQLLGIDMSWMVVSSICIFFIVCAVISRKYSKKSLVEFFNK